jgi:hypothetical protein
MHLVQPQERFAAPAAAPVRRARPIVFYRSTSLSPSI